MEQKKIDSETMREMMQAHEGMGVSTGKQDFSGGAVQFNVVNAFSTHFGKWAIQGPHIIVQIFPRAGAPDVYYDSRYTNDGKTYVAGRLEILPKGLCFPRHMEAVVKAACNLVTFGDVELDRVSELGAYVARFRDAQPVDSWTEEGGLLEQFFTEVDRLLEPEE